VLGGMMLLGPNGDDRSPLIQPRHREVFGQGRWAFLATLFEDAVTSCGTLPPEPMLLPFLRSGLSALQTEACCSVATQHADEPARKVSRKSYATQPELLHAQSQPSVACPTCQNRVQDVARAMGVPNSLRTSSFLRCRLTGLPMLGSDAEDVFPMVLPNGQAYSNVGLERMAASASGIVTCPATGETFLLEEARRAFVL
jgi:hypothetical protein